MKPCLTLGCTALVAQTTWDGWGATGCAAASNRYALQEAQFALEMCVFPDTHSKLEEQFGYECLSMIVGSKALISGEEITDERCKEMEAMEECIEETSWASEGYYADIVFYGRINDLASYIDELCRRAEEEYYAGGDDDGSGSGSGDGGGGDSSDPKEKCNCCKQSPCYCDKCNVCYGIKNVGGPYCPPCTCHCPQECIMVIMDNRTSRGVYTPETFVMVSDGSDREAVIYLFPNFPNTASAKVLPGYPKITGSGIVNGGYKGSTSTTYTVDWGPGCQNFTGHIRIVPENKWSMDAKIDLINTSLKQIAAKAKIALASLSTDLDIKLTVAGTGEVKRVDKYADGTTYGQYMQIGLGVDATFDLPEVKTLPIPVCPGLYVQATLKPGGFSFGGAVNGIYDESKSSPGDIQGTFSVGLVDLSLTGALGAGNPELLCTEVAASLGFKSLKVSGTFDYQNKAFIVTPNYELNQVAGELKLTAKFAPLDAECTPFKYTHVFCEGLKETGNPKTIFTLN